MSEALLRFCPAGHGYSLQATCRACGAATRSPHPARFSPADRWGRYRRALLAEVAARAP